MGKLGMGRRRFRSRSCFRIRTVWSKYVSFMSSHSQLNFYIFVVFVIMGVGSIMGLIILIGEILVHKIKKYLKQD